MSQFNTKKRTDQNKGFYILTNVYVFLLARDIHKLTIVTLLMSES